MKGQWRKSIIAGLVAGLIVELCVVLLVFAHYRITGMLLSGEGSADIGLVIFIGPALSLIIGVIITLFVKDYLN